MTKQNRRPRKQSPSSNAFHPYPTHAIDEGGGVMQIAPLTMDSEIERMGAQAEAAINGLYGVELSEQEFLSLGRTLTSPVQYRPALGQSPSNASTMASVLLGTPTMQYINPAEINAQYPAASFLSSSPEQSDFDDDDWEERDQRARGRRLNPERSTQNRNRPFKCSFCDWTFNRREHVLRHVHNKHKQQVAGVVAQRQAAIAATFNNANFPVPIQALIPEQVVQLTRERIQKCTYCEYESARKDNLRKHVRTKHRDLPLPADLQPTRAGPPSRKAREAMWQASNQSQNENKNDESQ